MFGKNDKFLSKMEKFAESAIEVSRDEMIELIKNTKFRYMKVWSTKLNGAGMRRMMETRRPTGNAPSYDYKSRGYWVMYSQADRGWRTIVLSTVDKVKLGNQFYKIK
jgi:hypothetical protein